MAEHDVFEGVHADEVSNSWYDAEAAQVHVVWVVPMRGVLGLMFFAWERLLFAWERLLFCALTNSFAEHPVAVLLLH